METGWKDVPGRLFKVQQDRFSVLQKVKRISSQQGSQAIGLRQSTPSHCRESKSHFSPTFPFPLQFYVITAILQADAEVAITAKIKKRFRGRQNRMQKTGSCGCISLGLNALKNLRKIKTSGKSAFSLNSVKNSWSYTPITGCIGLRCCGRP